MTSLSNLSFALGQIDRIQDQQTLLSQLSFQLTTGKKTDSFAELGTDSLISQRSRASLQSLETYDRNITVANTRISLMVLNVEEFKAQATTFQKTLVNFPQNTDHTAGSLVTYDDPLTANIENTAVGVDTADMDIAFSGMQDIASSMFDFMVDLMNTQDANGRYIMGGAETLTQPISEDGLLEASINTLISKWKDGTITTDDLIADITDRTNDNGNPDAITDTIVGYNAELSAGNAGNISVRVDSRTEFEYTATANEDAFRDVLVGLAFLKNETLPPIADVYENGNTPPAPPDVSGAPGSTVDEMKDNFYEVFEQVSVMFNKALDNIDQTIFRLENVRGHIEQVRQDHTVQRKLLADTVADVEDADLNEVAVKINTLTTQLEASYRVTATVQQLSLVNFL